MQPATSKLRMQCPDCKQALRIRTSRSINKVCREGIIECTNIESCGWRGNFVIQLTSTLVPSQQPAPDVYLPLTPRSAKALTQQ